ncbi:MAG: hypothetical protein MJ137_05005 [Clostridia bacterium]|nr:hypothetical protein [Clostridia bacterium]
MKLIKQHRIHPYLVIVISFAGVILAGTVLLSLPFSSSDGKSIGLLTSLFSATSAVCVTGLSVIDISATLSIWGKIIMAVLMEIGGISFITIAVFLFSVLGGKVGISDKLLLREALNQSSAGSITKLVRKIVLISLGIQLAATVVNFFIMLSIYDCGAAEAVGRALFHTIATYNNAGFDIFGSSSMVPFADNVALSVSTAILIILGSTGFTVFVDLYRKRRRPKLLSLNTKLSLITTFILIVSGTLTFRFTGGGDFSWLQAFFTSVTARTAGFTTVDLSMIGAHPASYTALIMLMITGASPCSTGGGIKTTTVAVIFIAIICYARGRKARAFGRSISDSIIFKAFVLLAAAVILVSLATFVISAVQPELGYEKILFEVASAFSTTGLSMGITSSLSSFSRIVIIVLMFVGRLGPLTVIGLVNRNWMSGARENISYPSDNVIIG